jgi:5-methylthioadenosine/S-adenosylhomocysteine deaminase
MDERLSPTLTGSGAAPLVDRISRRRFLAAAAAAGPACATGHTRTAPAGGPPSSSGQARPGGRTLLRGGCVLSMDPAIGDFDAADVLIEGDRIAAVGPDLQAPGAETIDARGSIVMPGFVDTHRHMWQGPLRNILPDGLLSDYTRDITGAARAIYRPEDARIGNLVSALGAIDAGITTVLDWSHIGNTPGHTDAAIEGLRESGIRAVYAYGGGTAGPDNRFPDDIRRIRAEHFASRDQLLTLAMAAGASPRDWGIARDAGAFISVHIVGSFTVPREAMGPDVTYIHCTNIPPEAWRLIADTGGHVSIAAPIEMQMGHGIPPIQEALDHGIRPSLSVDVETQMPGEMFTQMRTVFALQRMLALERRRTGGGDPRLLTVRDVVELATVQGARDNHLDDRIGSLTPGKQADVILLRTDTINVLPVNDAYGAVVLGMDARNVDTVFVAGRVRKRRGELVDVDLASVRRRVHASRAYVLEKTGWRDTLLRGGRERQ